MDNFKENKQIKKLKYIPPSIENNVDIQTFPNIIERYYTKRYNIDVCEPNNDHCILFHSNKLCLITLAPSHPILRFQKTITELNFQISKNVNRLKNQMSGKGKRGAQTLQKFSPLCFIRCSDGTVYTIYSNIPGKLIEINENLIDQPQMLTDHPLGKGYIAIIFTNINSSSNLRDAFLTPEQYSEIISNRNPNSP